MTETFLHNMWVTAFYVVTWPVALLLVITFSVNVIDRQLDVSRAVTAAAITVGSLLFTVGMSASVSGIGWDVR